MPDGLTPAIDPAAKRIEVKPTLTPVRARPPLYFLRDPASALGREWLGTLEAVEEGNGTAWRAHRDTQGHETYLGTFRGLGAKGRAVDRIIDACLVRFIAEFARAQEERFLRPVEEPTP